MSDPFIGEIKMFGANFAPRHWAFCNGQIVAIAQQEALFSLLGTRYGGDGQVSFAYPDMRGRVPVKYGQGNGLSHYVLGEKSGAERVSLMVNNMPSHNHQLQASESTADSQSPANNVLATTGEAEKLYFSGNPVAAPQMFSSQAVQAAGQGIAHDNMMPYTCINFIISLAGIYPSRS